MVFLKELLKKNDFEKISRQNKKAMKNYPGGKELLLQIKGIVLWKSDKQYF